MAYTNQQQPPVNTNYYQPQEQNPYHLGFQGGVYPQQQYSQQSNQNPALSNLHIFKLYLQKHNFRKHCF